MKNRVILFIALLGAIMLQSCNSNMPEMNENNRKLLLGPWEVVKETVTNGDGFGGSFTRTENFHWNIDSYYFYETYVVMWNSHAYYVADLPLYPYTLTEQKDGTWLITVPEMYDKKPNLDGGLSPITIHKLTKTTMEWEFESYGGDEGPVVYYQYLQTLYESAE